jgi:hypothetical protein
VTKGDKTMKSADLILNAGLLKALEALFTAVGEALIEQKISPTPALRKAHKQAFVALCEARSFSKEPRQRV